MAAKQFDDVWSNMGSINTGKGKWGTLGLFAVVCWNVWKAINDKVFSGSRQEEVNISAKVVAEFTEYCQAIEEGKIENGAVFGWQWLRFRVTEATSLSRKVTLRRSFECCKEGVRLMPIWKFNFIPRTFALSLTSPLTWNGNFCTWSGRYIPNMFKRHTK
ncbi:hypothetical protein RHGRI_016678 [Rhododendron griersonianum]|uniref:Uncharacterized protein n=1 Tax=Rhododendron griersonianum TaxID=479676 RepID=A0AAV6JV25_9ERIC|nr:hypothetical protein RHGRI_016678 [Rhododendron griersonianum]